MRAAFSREAYQFDISIGHFLHPKTQDFKKNLVIHIALVYPILSFKNHKYFKSGYTVKRTDSNFF